MARKKTITFTAVESLEIHGRDFGHLCVAFVPAMHEQVGGKKLGLMLTAPEFRTYGKAFQKIADALEGKIETPPQDRVVPPGFDANGSPVEI